MYNDYREKREWSEDELRQVIGDVLDNQLQSKYTPARSVLPQKLTPTNLDGSRPSDGTPLSYDAENDFLLPHGFALPTSLGSAKQVLSMNAAASALEFAGASYAVVYKSANQSINNAAQTIVSFDSEYKDTDGYHDTSTNNSRLTAQFTGAHLFFAVHAWDAAAGGTRNARFKVSGTTTTYESRNAGSSAANNYDFLVGLLEINADTYVELEVFQNRTGGTALDLRGGAWTTMFGCVFLGEG